MKLTEFQSKFSNDKDAMWNIVKLFHPNIPDTVDNFKSDKIFNVDE